MKLPLDWPMQGEQHSPGGYEKQMMVIVEKKEVLAAYRINTACRI